MTGIYGAIREASGFILITGGISLLVQPGRDVARSRLGLLFASIGFLFCLSAFDPHSRIPIDLGNLMILVALLAASQCLLDLVLYLFMDEPPPLARRFLPAGIAWSLAIWILPFIDYLLGTKPVGRSIEDGAPLGPIHAVSAVAIYLWPGVAVVVAGLVSRFRFRYLVSGQPATGLFFRGSIALGSSFPIIVAGAILGSTALYQAGHTILELILVSWYFITQAKPGLVQRARAVILEEKARASPIQPQEATLIAERVEKAIANRDILGRTDLDLRSLADIVKIPPHRLSIYFNAHEGQSFPSWLNARRIAWAQAMLRDEPGRVIIDIALDAGYASKSVFNTQFQRIVGMSPSAWRRSATGDHSGDPAGMARP